MRKSSSGAIDARTLVAAAKTDAEHSGEVVRQAVEASIRETYSNPTLLQAALARHTPVATLAQPEMKPRRTLKDLLRNAREWVGKKIAMPGTTSIQGVVLRRMAQVKLGDAHALDAGIIAMDHPIAMQALLSGQIDAHLTSAPYQLQEKVRGAHVVARSYQYFGAHSFLGAWETSKFYAQYPAFSQKFYTDVQAAIALINKNPTQVSHLLQSDSGGIPSWRQYKQWLAASGLTFTTRPLGMMRFANFMNKIGLIKKMPASWQDLVFPPVYGTKGS